MAKVNVDNDSSRISYEEFLAFAVESARKYHHEEEEVKRYV